MFTSLAQHIRTQIWGTTRIEYNDTALGTDETFRITAKCQCTASAKSPPFSCRLNNGHTTAPHTSVLARVCVSI